MMTRATLRHIFFSTLICTSFGSPSLLIAAGEHGQQGPNQGPIADSRALTADEQTIQTLLDGYATAMEEKSVTIMEGVVIPDDFSTIESGYPNWTWQDFRDNHLLVEMDTFTDVNYTIKLISGELQDPLGFAIYQYTASGKMQGQTDTVSISGLGTAILEKTSKGGWRIHHLHTSAPRAQLEANSN